MPPSHVELACSFFNRNPKSKIFRWSSPFALILVWKSLSNWKYAFHFRFGKLQKFQYAGILYSMDSIYSLKDSNGNHW